MTTALYLGTFDPPTLAHADIRDQALRVFDRVPVVLGRNPQKPKSMFHPSHRCLMWHKMGVPSDDYRIGSDGETALDWAKEFKATHVVRGIRGPEDLPGERTYRRFLQQASHGALDVVYFMTPSDLSDVSSTAVRQLYALRSKPALVGWVDSRIIDTMFDPDWI